MSKSLCLRVRVVRRTGRRRVIQKYLQSVPGMPSVTVNNRPGGSGTLAWSSLNLHPGDAHYISTLNTALVTNQIMGLSTLRLPGHHAAEHRHA